MSEPIGITAVLTEFTRRFAPHFPPVDGKTTLPVSALADPSRLAQAYGGEEVRESANTPVAPEESRSRQFIYDCGGLSENKEAAEILMRNPQPDEAAPIGHTASDTFSLPWNQSGLETSVPDYTED